MFVLVATHVVNDVLDKTVRVSLVNFGLIIKYDRLF